MVRGKREGKPKTFGGKIHQKLVDYATNRLLETEGVQTVLYEVDPGTGISIDVVGIKNGTRIGVECYVQAQLKKIQPRISRMNVDRIIFCVPNEKTLEKFGVFGCEVWNAEIEPWETTMKISFETRDALKAIGRKGESYDDVIRRLMKKEEDQ